MNILHLSDLHFGNMSDAHNWFSQLADDLKISLNCTKIDIIVISGDISNKSEPDEYNAAESFIKKLCTEFQTKNKNIVIVPGNHDLNWEVSKKAYRRFRKSIQNRELHEERFRNFSIFFKNITNKQYPLKSKEQAIINLMPEHKTVFIGLNSAWHIDHIHKEKADVYSEAISTAINELREKHSDYKRYYKFAVWHHPIHSPSHDRICDTGFVQRLWKNGFNVGFHGHIHKSEANLYRHYIEDKGGYFHFIGAGTFGSPTRDWYPGYPLQYNFIQLDRNQMTVETRCRYEINGVWKPHAIWEQKQGKDPSPRYTIELDTTGFFQNDYREIAISRSSELNNRLKEEVITAILNCSEMRDRDTRGALIERLHSDIRNSIKRHSADKVDVNNIVSRCLEFENGIQSLIKELEFFEGQSIKFKQLKEILIKYDLYTV